MISTQELLSSSFVTPILVALIGFIAAITSAVISKELKISEFRQSWINDLRNDLAIAIRCAYSSMYYITTYNKHVGFKGNIDQESQIHFDKYNDSFTEMEYRLILIKLRLNPDKDKELFEIIKSVLLYVFEVSNPKDYHLNFPKAQEAIDDLENSSHLILKSEWERVKNGEIYYRALISTGKLLTGVCLSAFLLLVLLANFPHLVQA